ncbi:hypothetical protein POTOM_042525 [Populus tomentosa]|uniref:Uncharacterized protein n=1 Tax=Populus tomentosa TaxID=118781 RepID=A0A8X7YPM9_POPTO|nr:hypothetical protein POTOM_042525 [Populus tomentosa]
MLLAAVAQFSAERIFDSKVRICENKPANGGGMSTKNSSHQEKDLMREKSLSRLLPSADPSSVSNGAMSFNAWSSSLLGNDLRGQFDGIHYRWVVNPGLYGDNKTRTYSFWTFLLQQWRPTMGIVDAMIFVALVSFKYDQS